MSETRSALIVDDEHDIRELLVLTLGRMGLRTDNAPTLRAAREMLATVSYDLCHPDMRLPDVSGLELIRDISPRFPNTPARTAERRVGKERVSRCRSRTSPTH